MEKRPKWEKGLDTVEKRPKWEKGQAVLYKKENSRFEMENTYGRLRYIKGDTAGFRDRKGDTGIKEDAGIRKKDAGRSRDRKKDAGRQREKRGFVLEAKEAPGTAGHTENEKRLKPDTVKKVSMKEERFLYAAGTPLKNQAVFYDVSEYERSREFLECMKRLITERRHQTLQDTFGFLEQDSERQLCRQLMQECKRETTLQEFSSFHRRIGKLNDRIMKKEAQERQMQKDLQTMLDREKQKERKKETKKAEEKEKTDYRVRKIPASVPEQTGQAEPDEQTGQTEPDEQIGQTEQTEPIEKK